MEIENTAVANFTTRNEAEQSIRSLYNEGFDIKLLTVIGKGYYSTDHILGFYNAWDRIYCWIKRCAINGAILGVFFGTAYFILLDFRSWQVLPWLVAYLSACWAFVFGVMGGISAAIVSIGIPKNSKLRYRKGVRAENYLLLAKGSETDLDKFREILGLHLHKPIIEPKEHQVSEL